MCWACCASGVTSLRQLKVLRLAGGATPPASFFERLTVLRQLEVLEFLPGVYGQLLNDMDVDMASANAGEGGGGGARGAGRHTSPLWCVLWSGAAGKGAYVCIREEHESNKAVRARQRDS